MLITRGGVIVSFLNTINDNKFSSSVMDIAQQINNYILDVTGNQVLESPISMYLAGGAAVNFYVSQRVSDDVDAVFSHRVIFPGEISSFYKEDDGSIRKVSFVNNYNESLSMMHPDYRENSIIVKNLGAISVRVLTPEDLIISKLSRFAENDESDAKLLIRAGIVDKEKLIERFNKASLYYIFDKKMVNLALDDVLEFFDEKESSTLREENPSDFKV